MIFGRFDKRTSKLINIDVEIIFAQDEILEINKFNIYINDVFFISLNPAAKGEKINYYKQRFYYMPKSSNNSMKSQSCF